MENVTIEKRMVAWNGHIIDDVGVIWCMVVENEPNYRQMIGRDELTAPWYLARLDDHRDEDGKVDYTALWRAAQRTVNSWNKEQGYSRSEVSEIVMSSVRASTKVGLND